MSVLTRRKIVCFSIAFGGFFSSVQKSYTQPGPTLVSAELKTVTDGDDRDHDTAVSAEVKEADGTSMLASIYFTETGGKYGYADGETHFLNIPLVQRQTPATKVQCQNFKFRMGIMAHGGIFSKWNVKVDGIPLISGSGGNDTWKFDAWLTLYFSDGSTLQSNKLNQTATSTGGKLEWDNLQ